MPGPESTPSSIVFPAGPIYPELLKSDARPGWVRYKVWSADWYTATLGHLVDQFGDLQANVGVEMALDGALSALSGAYDASVALMISSAERALGVPDDERLPPHRYDWAAFKKIAQRPHEDRGQATMPSIMSFPGVPELLDDVDQALEGQFDESPAGWLATLRRLRNQPMHQSALPRTWIVDWDTNETLDVRLSNIPGGDPVSYLKQSCDRTSALTERMISTANYFGFAGVSTPLLRTPWA
jgi:hypothetical protein